MDVKPPGQRGPGAAPSLPHARDVWASPLQREDRPGGFLAGVIPRGCSRAGRRVTTATTKATETTGITGNQTIEITKTIEITGITEAEDHRGAEDHRVHQDRRGAEEQRVHQDRRMAPTELAVLLHPPTLGTGRPRRPPGRRRSPLIPGGRRRRLGPGPAKGPDLTTRAGVRAARRAPGWKETH